MPASVRVYFRIQDEQVYILILRHYVVNTTKAYVISPTVAAYGPN